ncbi:hypothetical protein A9Q94_07560, partial [Rhodobacterales bacterium 56_14_T64]
MLWALVLSEVEFGCTGDGGRVGHHCKMQHGEIGVTEIGVSAGDLDPSDWEDFRVEARRMLEASIDQLQQVAERPWQEVPDAVKDGYAVQAVGQSAAEM